MQPLDVEIAGKNLETFPSLHIWGWEIAAYLFLGGLTAGLLILSGLAHRRQAGSPGRAQGWLGPVLAPAVLSLGMGALFLDLAHKLHMWRFYTTFQVTSPMSWGAWILVLVYPASLLFAWAPGRVHGHPFGGVRCAAVVELAHVGAAVSCQRVVGRRGPADAAGAG
ncbi:MAG: polysulfide reductase NrfD [Acidobacteria bacterium]|nr:polysulfide reductase NrfD [Acidobacteriota bacterium]